MSELEEMFFKEPYQNINYITNENISAGHIDDFLPEIFASSLYTECISIDNKEWKLFTRNNSRMEEWNDMSVAPKARELISYMHSSQSIRSLEKITNIQGLIPDPHLIGAGYSRIYKNNFLKIHTDFNWNDSLKLHRAVSLIIYLTPNWNVSWGGALNFYDKNRSNIIYSSDCVFNRCLIWNYNKFGYHGFENPLSCPTNVSRTAFRLFYYTSNSNYNEEDLPHRSLYWFDEKEKIPVDKKGEK
jgi:Rps23 Pro-64 3,4-dihydroxylase Tpa1-like proline 4-hydroxylase